MTGLNNAPGVTVVLNGKAVQDYLRSPDGPVLKSLVRRATLVQDAAHRQIRLGHIGGGTRGLSGARGNLRDSVVKRIIDGGPDGPFLRVGSENPIAFLHHEGTRPHVIRPRNAKMLRFPANGGNGGGFIYARQVRHPGTKPNRFLTGNLHLAVQ